EGWSGSGRLGRSPLSVRGATARAAYRHRDWMSADAGALCVSTRAVTIRRCRLKKVCTLLVHNRNIFMPTDGSLNGLPVTWCLTFAHQSLGRICSCHGLFMQE